MTQNKTAQNKSSTNTPSHIVWFAPERENAPWVRIGAQWPTAKGTGYRQVLEFTPNSDGNIIVMPFEKNNNAETGA